MTVAKGIALFVTPVIAAVVFATTASAAPTPAWIVESNKQATALLEENAKYSPESAAAIGVEGYDADVFDAKARTVQRQEADLLAVIKGYERALGLTRLGGPLMVRFRGVHNGGQIGPVYTGV